MRTRRQIAKRFWLALGLCACAACASDGRSRASPSQQDPIIPARPQDDAAAPSDGGLARFDASFAPPITTPPRVERMDASPPMASMPMDASLPAAASDAAPALQMPTMPAAPPGALDADGGDDDDAGPMFHPARLHCTGKHGAPGTTTRMYKDRSYIVHIPSALDPNAGVPLLFSFHGAGGKAVDMQTGTGFDVLADQLGFITVYPNGAMGQAPWNVGRGVCPPGNFVSTGSDDFAYFDAMLDGIEADQCIDRERVFAMGLSMGGYFAHNLGCQLPHGRVRAIAPHSSGTYSGDCPGAPLPVLILHGDSDSLINYQCGVNSRDYWVGRNGCSKEVDTLAITGGHCDFNRNCPSDGQVVLCTFNGLDHAYAFPPMYTFSSLLIWEFFAPYW